MPPDLHQIQPCPRKEASKRHLQGHKAGWPAPATPLFLFVEGHWASQLKDTCPSYCQDSLLSEDTRLRLSFPQGPQQTSDWHQRY